MKMRSSSRHQSLKNVKIRKEKRTWSKKQKDFAQLFYLFIYFELISYLPHTYVHVRLCACAHTHQLFRGFEWSGLCQLTNADSLSLSLSHTHTHRLSRRHSWIMITPIFLEITCSEQWRLPFLNLHTPTPTHHSLSRSHVALVYSVSFTSLSPLKAEIPKLSMQYSISSREAPEFFFIIDRNFANACISCFGAHPGQGQLKVAWDSCDVTHSLTQLSIHTSHVHGSKSCTNDSLHVPRAISQQTHKCHNVRSY